MPKRGNATGGNWPIVDVQFVSDFDGPDQSTVASKTRMNSSSETIRVHFDVPYSAKDNIRSLIEDGDLSTAYGLILKSNQEDPKNPSYPRACAVLGAALGLFDQTAVSSYYPPPNGGASRKRKVARRSR